MFNQMPFNFNRASLAGRLTWRGEVYITKPSPLGNGQAFHAIFF